MTFKHETSRVGVAAGLSLLMLAGSVVGVAAHPRHAHHVLARHWRFAEPAPLLFYPGPPAYGPDDYSVPMSGDTISGINGI
jgi:hypothetical protein